MVGSISNPIDAIRFDEFLQAPIGREPNGMILSVISTLARLDLDPRTEAEDLARLPSGAAVARLSGLLTRVPAAPQSESEREALSADLVKRLQRSVLANSSKDKKEQGIDQKIGNSPSDADLARRTRILLLVVSVTIMLGLQFLVGMTRSAPHPETSPPESSGETLPHIPPP